MPRATKIVIHFDDGSTHEVDTSEYGAVFSNEPRARACNHNPPYGKPPRNSGSSSPAVMSTSTAEEDDAGGGCYYINGVVVCP